MSTESVVGADACPIGWIVTVVENEAVYTDTYKQFSELYAAHREADQILVDIPIGLPTTTRRDCDVEAKSLLGCRGNSVFYPPSESAIEYENYDEASEAHEDSLKNGLSQQAFHIGDKIREVDRVVEDAYNGLVRESHPELCFAGLNEQPIAYSKSSDPGRGLRFKLLSQEFDNAEAIYNEVRDEYPLREVRRDDILDSMVLATVARDYDLVTVPYRPADDQPRIYYPPFDRSFFDSVNLP